MDIVVKSNHLGSGFSASFFSVFGGASAFTWKSAPRYIAAIKMQFSVIINSRNKRNKKSLDSNGDNLRVNMKCKWTPGKSPSPSHWSNAEWSVYLFKRLTLRALLISFIDLWWFKIQCTLGWLFSATDAAFIPFAVTVCSSDIESGRHSSTWLIAVQFIGKVHGTLACSRFLEGP